MKVAELLHPDVKIAASAIEQMSTPALVRRKKMEVVSGNGESARKLWRPYPDERAVHIMELELRLDGSGLYQRGCRRTHGPSMNTVEVAIDSESVEQVI